MTAMKHRVLNRCSPPPTVRRFFFGLLLACVVSSPSLEVAAQDLGDLEELAFQNAVAHAAPAVVRIETIGGLEQVGDVLLGDGPTTGLVVSSDGYILSSAFNFVRLPTSILVVLPGNKRVPAQIVSRDSSRMLVLLKIAAPNPLPVPEAAPLDQVAVGQWTIAVGRALSAEQPNMSVGILSAKNRIFGKAIQTDAKISPSNYGGPLIDLKGRVLGILVPMSPDSRNELAGSEWYDSGIGFAVPLEDIQRRLDRMKKGEDLLPGVLGVTLKQGDMYSLPAEVIAAHPKSPVYQAGLRAGDQIIECNGVPIERQVQLKHVLGPLYAGETVQLVTLRGDQRRSLQVPLVDQLSPYEHPFLGVLPVRNDSATERGVGVRYVYPGGAADKAGLRVGDRIVSLGGKPVASATELRETIAAFEPAGEVPVVYLRAGNEASATVRLAALPNELPEPRATERPPPAAASDVPVKQDHFVGISIPEELNSCLAFVPRTYRPEIPHGLVIYLPQPGEFNREAFTKRWQTICEQRDLIVVVPQAALPNMWLPTETRFVQKAVEHVLAKYTVDDTRIVAYGYQASGTMSYLVAFRHRELVRAVVAVDAGLSAFNRPPDNDPVERLAILAVVAEKSQLKARITAGVAILRELKYPTIVLEQTGDARDLDDQELQTVANWIDTLDRI